MVPPCFSLTSAFLAMNPHLSMPKNLGFSPVAKCKIDAIHHIIETWRYPNHEKSENSSIYNSIRKYIDFQPIIWLGNSIRSCKGLPRAKKEKNGGSWISVKKKLFLLLVGIFFFTIDSKRLIKYYSSSYLTKGSTQEYQYNQSLLSSLPPKHDT